MIFMSEISNADMDSIKGLVLVVDAPPIIDTLVHTKSRDLESEQTDKLIRGKGVLGEDLEGDVISNVLNKIPSCGKAQNVPGTV